MKMTKEQVEQARQLIWTCARTNNPSKAELRICFRELDTLCAAAREPESLVGKRVRLCGGSGSTGKVIAITRYRVYWDSEVISEVGPALIEPLEGDDAK